ncbi:CLUMA_CG003592, isoform A [Clunio marinus]|uniref:CLUMA_CG003592, isoform A n=1 Tax=Clunio marinus TaxID=568069 RepID=A0A1J1HUI4_9DIPT|nr:CLUMA_CG003592, isoform A [Clunio marinus]
MIHMIEDQKPNGFMMTRVPMKRRNSPSLDFTSFISIDDCTVWLQHLMQCRWEKTIFCMAFANYPRPN